MIIMEALEDYSKAIEINPSSDTYIKRGQLKNHNDAISDFSEAIKLDPNLSYAYYIRGLERVKIKSYHDAITDFTKAIESGYKNTIDCKEGCNHTAGTHIIIAD